MSKKIIFICSKCNRANFINKTVCYNCATRRGK